MPEIGLTEVGYSPIFLRQFGRLPVLVRKRFLIREQWFRANPYDPRLKAHALTGKLEGTWSFSVTYAIRAVFTFESKTSVIFHRIGTHDVSYRSL